MKLIHTYSIDDYKELNLGHKHGLSFFSYKTNYNDVTLNLHFSKEWWIYISIGFGKNIFGFSLGKFYESTN
jgi:hypothetical protein